MKALKQLFMSSFSSSGQNYHYQSSTHDLSFISFENRIYFILSKNNEKCLYGTIKLKNGDLSFDLDKNSSWIKPDNIKDEKSIDLLYDTYNFMSPVINKKNKP